MGSGPNAPVNEQTVAADLNAIEEKAQHSQEIKCQNCTVLMDKLEESKLDKSLPPTLANKVSAKFADWRKQLETTGDREQKIIILAKASAFLVFVFALTVLGAVVGVIAALHAPFLIKLAMGVLCYLGFTNQDLLEFYQIIKDECKWTYEELKKQFFGKNKP